ncbi:MAG: hypothetical protein CMI09_15465 [Oceanospirillaceae bacterium]|nr:hypothetical protein [Oceanospirillaceae bacterium]
MENPFLNRSSAILGFLLAVSPIANAETSGSSLDNPEVLKQILSLVAKKAEAPNDGIDREYRLGDSDALNNADVMSSLLKQLPKTQLKTVEGNPDAVNNAGVFTGLVGLIQTPTKTVEGNPDAVNNADVLAGVIGLIETPEPGAESATSGDADALNNSAIMQNLVGLMSQMDTGSSTMQDPVVATDALNDPAILQGILPLIAASAPGVSSEIFEPTPRTFNFVDNVPQRFGTLGLSLGQQTSSHFGDAAVLGTSVRYHLTERWDALFVGTIGMTQLSTPEIKSGTRTEMEKNESFYSFTAGASYGLLKGITSFNGETYLPWQLSTDFLIGEQYTGSSHGLYTGVGTTLSVMFDEYWVGAETRYYQVDDEVLNKVGQHRGLQWSIAVGFYY